MEKKTTKILIIISAIILAGGLITAALFLTKGTIKNKKDKGSDKDGNIINGPFQPEEIRQAGKHIYYSSRFIENNHMERDEVREVMDYLEILDETLTEDIFVCGAYKSYLGGRNISAYQYLNGAIIPDVYYQSALNASYPTLVLTDRHKPVTSLDTTDIIPAEELFDKVMDLAEINRDKMFFDKNDQTEITGTYRLEYDANKDILYYSFRINEYSEVCINAKTGDFTKQHFWDGVYVD